MGKGGNKTEKATKPTRAPRSPGKSGRWHFLYTTAPGIRMALHRADHRGPTPAETQQLGAATKTEAADRRRRNEEAA